MSSFNAVKVFCSVSTLLWALRARLRTIVIERNLPNATQAEFVRRADASGDFEKISFALLNSRTVVIVTIADVARRSSSRTVAVGSDLGAIFVVGFGLDAVAVFGVEVEIEIELTVARFEDRLLDADVVVVVVVFVGFVVAFVAFVVAFVAFVAFVVAFVGFFVELVVFRFLRGLSTSFACSCGLFACRFRLRSVSLRFPRRAFFVFLACKSLLRHDLKCAEKA